jgi:hypothetical protein
MPTKYRVELLDRKTSRQLDRIHEPDFSRIADAILQLEDEPRPPGCRRLRELEGWRIRVGVKTRTADLPCQGPLA